MTISPLSNVSSLAGVPGSPSNRPASKSTASSQQPADTVQLSSAALAHLSGADVDHDGDSH